MGCFDMQLYLKLQKFHDKIRYACKTHLAMVFLQAFFVSISTKGY